MKKFSTILFSTLGVFGSAFISIAGTQRSSPFPSAPNKNLQNHNDLDSDETSIDESTMDTLPDAEQLLELRETDRLCSGNQPLDSADQRSITRDAQEHLIRHFSGQPHTD